jgi:hypothetical protein
MAINNNKPVQPMQQAGESLQKMNKVTKTAIEAVTDKIYDADGDKTSFKDVKKAADQLSTSEKVALGAGIAMTGGALAAVSLIAEEGLEVGKKIGTGAGEIAKKTAEAVQKKYSEPPEKKMAEALEKEGRKILKDLEKFGDKMGDYMDKKYSNPPEKKAAEHLQKLFQETHKGLKDIIKDAF